MLDIHINQGSPKGGTNLGGSNSRNYLKVSEMNSKIVPPDTVNLGALADTVGLRSSSPYMPRNLIFVLLDVEHPATMEELTSPSKEKELQLGLKHILELCLTRSWIRANESSDHGLADAVKIVNDVQKIYSQTFVVAEQADKQRYNMLRRYRQQQESLGQIRLLMIEPSLCTTGAVDAWLLEKGKIGNIRNAWTPGRELVPHSDSMVPLGKQMPLAMVMTEGVYQQRDPESRTAEFDFPTNEDGLLHVSQPNGKTIWQIYRPTVSDKAYRRCRFSGMWSAWEPAGFSSTIHTTFEIDGELHHSLEVLDMANAYMRQITVHPPTYAPAVP